MNVQTQNSLADLLCILRARHLFRLELFEKSSKRIITIFCELVLNIIYGEIDLTDGEKTILKNYKGACLLIIKKIKSFKTKIRVILSLQSQFLDLLATILTRYVN